MSKFEYDIQEFKLVEKLNFKQQAETLADLRGELNQKVSTTGSYLVSIRSTSTAGLHRRTRAT